MSLSDTPTPDELRVWADTLTAANDPVGALVRLELDGGDEAAIQALRKQCCPVQDVGLTWDTGRIVGARKADHKKSGVPWLGALLTCTAGRQLRSLWLTHSRPKNNYKPVLSTLMEHGAPALRELTIDKPGGSGFSALAGLAASSPHLERLELVGRFDDAAIKGLSGPWPRLRVLSLDLHGTPVWKKAPKLKSYLGLLSAEALPAIRHLRLQRAGAGDELLDHLLGCGVLARLESLFLGGFFTAEAIARFFENCPSTCNLVLVRHEADAEGQRVAGVVHRCASPELEADYQRLWTRAPVESWWESEALPFSGTTLHTNTLHKTTHTERDGLRHGRATTVSKTRTDEHWWFGVKHGFTSYLSKDGAPGGATFRDGLRDERVEATGTDGVRRIYVYELGERVALIVPDESPAMRAARALRERLGFEFTLRPTDFHRLGPPGPPTPDVTALPLVAAALQTSDDGVTQRTMTTHRGERLTAATWFLGDTLCGAIIEAGQVIATIEDGEIHRAP